MKPIGQLMTEHRLIEKMLVVLEKQVSKAEAAKNVEPVFIDTVVDFIRTYADKTHHAKEEEILFRDIAKKALSREVRTILHELIDEHNYARKTVRELIEAKESYRREGGDSLATVLEKLKALVIFYRGHIDKEDNVFFPACLEYLSTEEEYVMLHEFWESDRKMIHEKYTSVVMQLESEG